MGTNQQVAKAPFCQCHQSRLAFFAVLTDGASASVQRSGYSPPKRSAAHLAISKRRLIYAILIPIIVMVSVCFWLVRPTSGPKQESATPLPTQATTITPPPGFLPDIPDSGQQREPTDPRPREYKSLPSGTRLAPDLGGGYGRLTADNGRDEDAVVRLSDAVTDQTIRYVFVQAHSSVHVDHIPQGTYRLAYTTGLNWIESEDTFSWHADYHECERIFEYRPYKATSITVTLHPVPFGNLRTKRITREEFLMGHHHVNLQR